MDWFLYDWDLRHKRVKHVLTHFEANALFQHPLKTSENQF